MKNIIFIVSGLILLSVSCRKDIDLVDTSYIFPGPKEYIKTSVGGIIVDEGDNVISNVKVSIGDKSLATDKNGIFLFKNIVVDSKNIYIRAEYPGYFTGSHTIITKPGTRNSIKIQLLSKTTVKTYQSNQIGSAIYNDYSVEIPANAVITEDGTDYTGLVKIVSKWLDPTSDKLGDKMPGRLIGLSSGGSITGLTTMGMIAVELLNNADETLRLKDGFEATIKMKVPKSIVNKAPVVIPLWYFDEKNGIWKEEGSANLINGTYEGKVKHFTFWNCDYNVPFVEMVFKIVDQFGKPIEGAYVFAQILNLSSVGSGISDNNGEVSGFVPKDEIINIQVSLPFSACMVPALTQQIGPYSQNSSIILTINNNLNNYTISGDVIDCDNNPVTEGYIYIKAKKDIIWVNNSGHFEKTLMICGQPTVSIILKGIDIINFKSSQDIILNLSSGDSVNIGTIQACDAVSDYITYSFNGDTYTYADPHFAANLYNILEIERYHTPQSIGMQIEILNLKGLGLYSIGSLDATGEDKNGITIRHGCQFCGALTANITEYNGPGSYVAGTFSGMVNDSSNYPTIVPINVSGTFRSIWNK